MTGAACVISLSSSPRSSQTPEQAGQWSISIPFLIVEIRSVPSRGHFICCAFLSVFTRYGSASAGLQVGEDVVSAPAPGGEGLQGGSYWGIRTAGPPWMAWIIWPDRVETLNLSDLSVVGLCPLGMFTVVYGDKAPLARWRGCSRIPVFRWLTRRTQGLPRSGVNRTALLNFPAIRSFINRTDC